MHYTTLYHITLHCTTLHCTALHCTTLLLHYTALHYTTLHYTTLHHITSHYTTPHYTTHYTTVLVLIVKILPTYRYLAYLLFYVSHFLSRAHEEGLHDVISCGFCLEEIISKKGHQINVAIRKQLLYYIIYYRERLLRSLLYDYKL